MTKVLIVCSGNAPNFKFEVHQAFVFDQVNAISKNYPEVNFDYFFIQGTGINGYLSNLKRLKRRLKVQKFDIIHAHFALSGLLANLQRSVPVVCSFHGSDINLLKNRFISIIVAILSKKTIYVSNKLYNKAIFKKDKNIIPCGVDFGIFNTIEKKLAQQKMNLNSSKKYILFSSSFTNKIKNYQLLKEALGLLKSRNIEILELKDYSREEVALLINAADICVMTSLSEGSPQFIKEAMACNCPIVSTEVGDVKDLISGTDGSYLTSFDPFDVAEKIKMAFAFGKRTNGRENIQQLDNNKIAKRIVSIYENILQNKEL